MYGRILVIFTEFFTRCHQTVLSEWLLHSKQCADDLLVAAGGAILSFARDPFLSVALRAINCAYFYITTCAYFSMVVFDITSSSLRSPWWVNSMLAKLQLNEHEFNAFLGFILCQPRHDYLQRNFGRNRWPMQQFFC